MREIQILRKHARGKPKSRIVRPPHNLLNSLVGQDTHDGAEDLLLHDAHVIGAIRKHSGADPKPLLQLLGRALGQIQLLQAPIQQRRPIDLNPVADIPDHLLVMRPADQRAEVRAGVHEVPGPDIAHLPQQRLLERLLHGAGHEDASPIRAHLARAVEIRHHGPINRLLDIRIAQHHERRLPAQLHRHILHAARCGGRNLAARRDLPRKRHLRDARVRRQVRADLGGALHDVEHPRRQPGLGVQLRQRRAVQRRELGRLVHHRVAGGQARRALPQRDLQRVVPRADADADAQRLLACVHPRVGPEGCRLAVQTTAADEVGEVLEHVGARGDVDGGGFRERFARVFGLERGEEIVARAEEGGGAEQDARALWGRSIGPGGEGARGGGDGGVDVGWGGGADCGEWEGCGGVDGLECLGGGGGLRFAVIEEGGGWDGGHDGGDVWRCRGWL